MQPSTGTEFPYMEYSRQRNYINYSLQLRFLDGILLRVMCDLIPTLDGSLVSENAGSAFVSNSCKVPISGCTTPDGKSPDSTAYQIIR